MAARLCLGQAQCHQYCGHTGAGKRRYAPVTPSACLPRCRRIHNVTAEQRALEADRINVETHRALSLISMGILAMEQIIDGVRLRRCIYDLLARAGTFDPFGCSRLSCNSHGYNENILDYLMLINIFEIREQSCPMSHHPIPCRKVRTRPSIIKKTNGVVSPLLPLFPLGGSF